MSEFSENVPEGVKQLYGTLYVVPFNSIIIPDADGDEKEYKFTNPRMLTEQGTADLMDKRLSADLRESIKVKTLLNPLVCRWVKKDGVNRPQLVGGDRRYRAVDFLIRKKEIVTDPRSLHLNDDGEWTYKQVSADEAYATIPCQIFAVANDLDALALSWAENKGRIDLTEGHEVAEVIKLRKFGASDDKILEILQREEKWLAETDRLIAELDHETLADLIESRMTRACAAELCAINDVELRTKIRTKANEAAQETYQKKIKRYQAQIEKALDEREIAEGAVADAEFHNDEEGVAAAEAKVEEASAKVTSAVQKRDSEQPMATARNARDAASEAGVKPTKPRNGNGNGSDNGEKVRMLKSAKVEAGRDYLDKLIKNNGQCLENPPTFVADVEELKLARRILNNNVLANEEDFALTIKRHIDGKKKK